MTMVVFGPVVMAATCGIEGLTQQSRLTATVESLFDTSFEDRSTDKDLTPISAKRTNTSGVFYPFRGYDARRPPARIAARSRAKNRKSRRLPVAIESRDGEDLAITAVAGVARERIPRRPTTPEPVRAVDPR
jgi:hypothetical protein